jgi:uncharacterized membrane protein (UPF0127 family)
VKTRLAAALARALFALSIAATAAAVTTPLACKSDAEKRAGASAPRSTPAVTVDAGGRKIVFHVELALTPDEQARGLMYRTELAPDAGMLFVFDEAHEHPFWMKNTLVPLDMIFIGADRRIAGIVENAEPQTLTERTVRAPSQYVLEIGGGLSQRLGIRAGQAVEISGVPLP